MPKKKDPALVLSEINNLLENGTDAEGLVKAQKRLYHLDANDLTNDQWVEKLSLLDCIKELLAEDYEASEVIRKKALAKKLGEIYLVLLELRRPERTDEFTVLPYYYSSDEDLSAGIKKLAEDHAKLSPCFKLEKMGQDFYRIMNEDNGDEFYYYTQRISLKEE